MSRNGSGVYTLPAGSTVANGDTSDATDINTPLADLETDANTARPIVAGGTGATTASAARTALGLAIGTDVQAYDAGLASIAGLTTAADKMVYTTASDTYAVTALTSFARTVLDDTTAAAARTTLGAMVAAPTQATDWNSATTDGFYWGNSSATNAPSAHDYRGFVVSQNGDTDNVTQFVIRGGADNIYMRRRNTGTFASWVEVIHTGNIDANASAVGVGQTWQDVSASRAVNTNYQNTTGRPIMVSMVVSNSTAANDIDVSSNASTWLTIGKTQAANASISFVLPDTWYYRIRQTSGTTTISNILELKA